FLWQIGSAPAIEDHEEDHPLEQPKSNRAPRIEYQYQLAIDLVCIEGPNKGAQLVYKPTSQGGRKMLGKLAGEIARRKERGDDDYVPSIALWADDYYSRKWGRTIWNPQADILDWYTMEDDVLKETAKPARAEKAVDKRAAAKPAKADRRSAREEPEEEAAPRTRSRRDERGGAVEREERRGRPAPVEEPEEEDEAETVDARPRGRGRPEPEARGGRRERPARDAEPRGRRPARDEEPEEEERAPRRAAGRGRR